MKTGLRSIAAMIMAFIMLATLVTGCGAAGNTNKDGTNAGTAGKTSAASDSSASAPVGGKIELTMFIQWNEPFVEPADDVVGAAIKEKGWDINVKDHLYESGQNWTEKLNLFVASGTLPDVFEFPVSGVDTVAKFADRFVDMSSILTDPQKCPNLSKYLTPSMLEAMKTQSTKKLIYWPTEINPDFSDPKNIELYKEQYTEEMQHGYMISVREDVLTSLGYKFKPVADLEKEFEANNRRLTYDESKIEPEIKTMADFEKFLQDIKALNLKTKDGLDIYPFGGIAMVHGWGGPYRVNFFNNLDGAINGWFGSPNVKTMYKDLNRLYRTGLYSPETYTATSEQLKEAIVSGQYASWCTTNKQANEAFEKNYNVRVRYLPLPRYKADVPQYMENIAPGPFEGLLINKEYKDLDTLIRYLDWLWSDEGSELAFWGKEGGIWEIKDGKKVFKDEKLLNAIKTGTKTENNEDANYYGLFNLKSVNKGFASPYVRGFFRHGKYNKFNYLNSYKAKYDFVDEMRRVSGSFLKGNDGTITNIPYGEEAGKVNNFWWQKSWEYEGQFVLAKNDEDFEKVWTTLMDDFHNSCNYEKAMEQQAEYFKAMQAK